MLVWDYQRQASTERLRNLLAQQKWKEANIYTSHIILFVVGRKIRGRFGNPRRWKRAIYKTLRPILKLIGFNNLSSILSNLTLDIGSNTIETEEINRFPCSVLHEIDRLWTTSSNGHFGFSVQMSIYEEIKHRNSLPSPFVLNVSDRNEFIPITSVDYSLHSIKDGNILSLIEKLEWSDYQPKIHLWTDLRNVEHFKYNLNAQQGHLPFLFNYEEDSDFFQYGHNVNMVDMTSLWNRFKSCK